MTIGECLYILKNRNALDIQDFYAIANNEYPSWYQEDWFNLLVESYEEDIVDILFGLMNRKK